MAETHDKEAGASVEPDGPTELPQEPSAGSNSASQEEVGGESLDTNSASASEMAGGMSAIKGEEEVTPEGEQTGSAGNESVPVEAKPGEEASTKETVAPEEPPKAQAQEKSAEEASPKGTVAPEEPPKALPQEKSAEEASPKGTIAPEEPPKALPQEKSAEAEPGEEVVVLEERKPSAKPPVSASKMPRKTAAPRKRPVRRPKKVVKAPEKEPSGFVRDVAAAHSEIVADVYNRYGEDTIVVRSGGYHSLCRHLRDQAALRFDYLSLLTGAHYVGTEPRCEVVLELYSTPYNRRVRVKVLLPAEAPSVDSVADLWPTAGWQEREAYDMLGIHFHGHSDLRRILLPQYWEGHPLRKDYPWRGFRERSEEILQERLAKIPLETETKPYSFD